MKTPFIERFVSGDFLSLDEQRRFMLDKIQRSKAGSSRYYPVFAPLAASGGHDDPAKGDPAP